MLPYRQRLKQNREIYINGKLISDLTQIQAFQGALDSVERYYSLQVEEPGTYLHREGSQDIPISLMVPRCKQDLARKRAAYKGIADISFGMLGRTPDFINAALAALTAHADVLGSDQHADFAANIRQYYSYRCAQNLFVAHGSINPLSGLQSLSSP